MIEQLIIGLSGPTAVTLSQFRSRNLRRWGALIGLVVQPFWFYTTFIAGQWGMFVACFFYLAAWILGVYNGWIRKEDE